MNKQKDLSLNNMDVPKHIAIIMDGNGRWATAQGKSRTVGHKEGAKAVRKVVESAGNLGVKYLTLWAFSSDNWKRPKEEVDTLMSLLRQYLKKELPELLKEGVRLTVIGNKDELDEDIKDLIKEAEEKTKGNEKLFLNIGINYGGRNEIVMACRKIAERVKKGTLEPDYINEELFAHNLYTSGMPDPDLVIRTSGEYRLSGWLPWQITYSELMFMPVYWPDFNEDYLKEAISEYQSRERRFGKV